MGAAKQGEQALVAADLGIPDLGGSSAVAPLGVAEQDAVLGGGQEVRFELEGGKAGGAVRQSGEGAVAAGGVGQRDERRRVQVAGRGQQLAAGRQPGGDRLPVDVVKLDAEQGGQMLGVLVGRRQGWSGVRRFGPGLEVDAVGDPGVAVGERS